MFTVAIPREQCEAYMCKSFGSRLQSPALQWYTNLANNSISPFDQLTNPFVEQFATVRSSRNSLVTSNASNSDTLSRSEITLDVSIEKRSLSHFAIRKP